MSFRVLVVSTVISAKILPNTIFLDKYRKLRATYRFDGTERPISKSLMQRFYDVLNDLNVSAMIRTRIKVFSVHDISTFHAGTTMSSYGGLIGIPPNYEYENVEDASVGQIEIENKNSTWSEETREKFLECLVLSENAQKFAIAREVLNVQRPEIWVETFITGMDCFIMFMIYDAIYKTGNFAKKSRMAKLGLQVWLGLVTLFMCLMTKQALEYHADGEITEELAKLGPEYIQGGKEFYEKLCELQDIKNKTSAGYFKQQWMRNKYLNDANQKEFLTLKLQELENVTM
ncbi:transmembrane protein 177 [Megachile rotundata]|uniref:transmembrane protein 177 n=1 Tax=Megachile rotundata TaxID=143995 RepID=UPI000258D90F|nr:PREDICTED: transmembrane protein 177 [Megachile rotundata]XP_012138849.1 PREDICTED: transmembrane protein 177 [Megachile rotundata]